MAHNKDIWLITADLGYKLFDDIRRDYPGRFLNVGASEQAMICIAVGLALEGKIPFCYSITPFLLYRPFEAIRNYVNHESIPVKLVGSGRNKDYLHDGFSHWAEEDEKVMEIFDNINPIYPEILFEHTIEHTIDYMIESKKPEYLNLKRNI